MLELSNITSMHLKLPIKISDPMMIKHASASDGFTVQRGSWLLLLPPTRHFWELTDKTTRSIWDNQILWTLYCSRFYDFRKGVFSKEKKKEDDCYVWSFVSQRSMSPSSELNNQQRSVGQFPLQIPFNFRPRLQRHLHLIWVIKTERIVF